MAGTVSSSTSSLASELLLNKIMNGQVQTSTGKSITSVGRSMSNKLSGNAYELRTAEKNMVLGESYVSAAQGEVTSLKDQLLSVKKNLLDLNNTTGATTAQKQAVQVASLEAYSQYSQAIAKAKFNGDALFAAGKKSFNGGNNMTIGVLGDNLSTNKTVSGNVRGCFAKITTAAGAANAIKAVDSAIGELEKFESKYSESIKALQNRQLLLADQGASLDSAAAGQSVASLSGANNLLSSMLGSDKA